MINSALGTLFALWFYNNFVGWLGLLSSALPPVGAILPADYFLVRKGNYPDYETTTFANINPSALIAWVAGIAAPLMLPGIAPINGVIVAAISHVILQKAPIFQGRIAQTTCSD